LKTEFSLVRLECVSRFGAVLMLLTEFWGEGGGSGNFYFLCPPKQREDSSREICNYFRMPITF
jgi:hypothetical protein